MRLYRGRIGAILIASLLTGAAPGLLSMLTGDAAEQRDSDLFWYIVFPIIAVSALLGIVVVMIPAEAIAQRRGPQFAPAAAVLANCVLVEAVALWSSINSPTVKLGMGGGLFLAIAAALLWLAVDRLYRKAFNDA